MAEAYALHEGAFGTAIVLEAGANLVSHAHSETHLALWLGGVRACAHVGEETVIYGENVALGVNAFEAHDMVLLEEPGSNPGTFWQYLGQQVNLHVVRRDDEDVLER